MSLGLIRQDGTKEFEHHPRGHGGAADEYRAQMARSDMSFGRLAVATSGHWIWRG